MFHSRPATTLRYKIQTDDRQVNKISRQNKYASVANERIFFFYSFFLSSVVALHFIHYVYVYNGFGKQERRRWVFA